MTDLADFRRVASGDGFLCIVATTRADGSVQASLVNAGVMTDPAGTRRGRGVRGRGRRGQARAPPGPAPGDRGRARRMGMGGRGGAVELIGPDDPAAGFDAERLRLLLREVFVAAGGTHDDWDGYDAAMATIGASWCLVQPERVYSNG